MTFPARLPADRAPRLDPLSVQWLARAALDGLSPATLRSYRGDIRSFLHWSAQRFVSDWHCLDDDLLVSFLADEYARGVGRRLAARRAGVLASVLDFGRELGHPLARLTMRPRSHRPIPQVLQPAAIAAVIHRTRGDGYFAVRDRALLDLLYCAGITAGETCALDVDHVDLAAGLLDVTGKRRTRRVPVAISALEQVRAWLTIRRPIAAARAALFLDSEGGRLQPDALLRICHRRSVAAGQIPPLSPRILRNSYAAHMLERGAQRHQIAALLGLSLSQADQLARAVMPYRPKG